MSQIWFITGSPPGIGGAPAAALLAAGHRLVATARSPKQLSDLVAVGEYVVTHVWRRRFSRNAPPATNTACSKGRRQSCGAIRYGRACAGAITTRSDGRPFNCSRGSPLQTSRRSSRYGLLMLSSRSASARTAPARCRGCNTPSGQRP
jgi:hypothetical protein